MLCSIFKIYIQGFSLNIVLFMQTFDFSEAVIRGVNLCLQDDFMLLQLFRKSFYL